MHGETLKNRNSILSHTYPITKYLFHIYIYIYI